MPLPPVGRRRRFQRALLDWYATSARRLPWRSGRDAYRVLVSEVMLQQTQVSRVEPIFSRFVERFGDIHTLAAATPAAVLSAWQGLGYNRRALNLHRTARAVVADHGGHIPRDVATLRTLPGIGEYTARAVAAFAYGVDAAPVDTNVARVLARAVEGGPLPRGGTQRLADAMVPSGEAADWGQALMDLGAGWCTARRPRCGPCPVAAVCAWRGSGTDEDPASPAQVPPPAARPFAGSDRYHRGRIVDALREGPLDPEDLPRAADLDDTPRLTTITTRLEDEGLVEWCGGRLRLPG